MYIKAELYGQSVLFGIFGKIYIQVFSSFFFSQSGNKQFQIRKKHQLNMVTVTDPNTYLHISAPRRS